MTKRTAKTKLAYSKNNQLQEGKVKLLVPEETLKDPHHARVFYNPVMSLNRSLSSLFIKQAIADMHLKDVVCFDGFSGMGVRGMRYLAEANVNKVVFSEANDDAIPYIEANLKLNKIKKSKAVVLHKEVFPALAESENFDVIELDPFGTPVHALDPAFKRLKNKSILSVTFTDLANLCGGHPAACKRHYDSKSINCTFSHEVALRIALAKTARVAAMHDFAITPLACWYEGHYVKLILACERGAAKADACLKQLGCGFLCRKCLTRGVGQNNMMIANCPNCKNRTDTFGAIWTSAIGNRNFIQKATSKLSSYKEKQKTEIENFVNLLLNDVEGPIFFYSLPEIAKHNKTQVPRLTETIEKLQKAGFVANRTHYDKQSLKTNASVKEIK
ncbi:MAG: RsmD family RNA methyltransferase [Candidatus Woesearchaeota archaeon]|nr:RsmD family RNA methyltransferase [Candidatus Woesearchaeota archaeon]